MDEVAAHLVDHLLPKIPMRQWVLSFPKRLRPFLKDKPALHNRLLSIVTDVLTKITKEACSSAPEESRTGAVSFIQRFGSILNSHVHYHICMTDGLFYLSPSKRLYFYEPFEISKSAVYEAEEEIRRRVIGLFRRRNLLSKDDARSMLDWKHSGFSLHGEVRVHSEDRSGLERLIRYCARPPFASENLKWVKPGKLLTYNTSKGDNHSGYQLHLSPMQLIDRLANFIPPPRAHCHRYHGVLAPNSPIRRVITAFAGRPIPHYSSPLNDLMDVLGKPVKEENKSPNYLWAELLARIYEVFPLECPSCGETMKLVAFITDPLVIRRILSHMGISTDPPHIAQARDPPQMELHFSRLVYREDIDLLLEVEGSEDPFPEIIDAPHQEEVYVESLDEIDQTTDW